jgi:multidrug transporter EmrE-like cation transporter
MLLSIILIMMCAGLTVIADIYLKESEGKDPKKIGIGIVIYAVIAVPSVLAFKYIQFGTYYLLWEVLTTAIAVMVGTFYFKEKFTLMRLLAIVFTFATILAIYRT